MDLEQSIVLPCNYLFSASELLSGFSHVKPYRIVLDGHLVSLYGLYDCDQIGREQVYPFVQSLTEYDINRYQEIVNEYSATSFVLGRLLLRRGISRLLDIDPVTIQINAKVYQKPRYRNCCFSISRSNGYLAGVFCRGLDLGIDIEVPRNEVDVDEIVSQYFPDFLRTRYREEGPDSNHQVFWKLWTSLEARVKLTGQGLVGIDSIDSQIDVADIDFQGQPIVGCIAYARQTDEVS